MQFVARNVAKVELDSTSETIAGNVAENAAPCVREFNSTTVATECIKNMLTGTTFRENWYL